MKAAAEVIPIERPHVAHLDGTLITSDLAIESYFALLAARSRRSCARRLPYLRYCEQRYWRRRTALGPNRL